METNSGEQDKENLTNQAQSVKPLRVLNLYAGIGGNRKLWPENIEVTAVELNLEIAKIYQDFFPKDKVLVEDAHQYLLEHYMEYDFIWSSPPCQSHSITNNFLNAQGVIRYPDMGLYQEIIFLNNFCSSKWVVENVKGYYKPLIEPQLVGRHYFWSNFKLNNENFKMQIGRMNGDNQKRNRSYKLDKLGFGKVKDVFLRNCVKPEIGLYVFNCAFRQKQAVLGDII